MPELPDITVYVEQLDARVRRTALHRVRLLNPFVLRTAQPPIAQADGQQVLGVRRLGKRIVLALEGELFLVIHLMIAGRLRWLAAGATPPARGALAAFEFDAGTLLLTEAGTQRRASIHLAAGEPSLAALDPGGAELEALDEAGFTERLKRENHTLKRALTDPRLFSGIGNAYSDEILHRARLSPVALTRALPDADAARLFTACLEVMADWSDRLRAEAARRPGGWPDQVTAFRPGMAVHGR
jgi:formamidopyrimidine-DNA glycosylase